MIIIVQDGQSISDIALRYYGNVSSVDILIKDNALTYDSDLLAGQSLIIRDTATGNIFTNTVTTAFEKSNSTINNFDYIKKVVNDVSIIDGGVRAPIIISDARTVSNTWTVQQGQSIFDIVLQFYNDLSFTEIFLVDNGLSHDDTLKAGDTVILQPDLIVLQTDNTVVNNADYIDRLLGDLRIDILAVGNETSKGNDGYILVDVKGGTMPYTYFWSNGSSLQNLIAVPSGTYTLTVVDAISNTASITVTLISVVTLDYLITDNFEFVICDDGSRILVD